MTSFNDPLTGRSSQAENSDFAFSFLSVSLAITVESSLTSVHIRKSGKQDGTLSRVHGSGGDLAEIFGTPA